MQHLPMIILAVYLYAIVVLLAGRICALNRLGDDMDYPQASTPKPDPHTHDTTHRGPHA